MKKNNGSKFDFTKILLKNNNIIVHDNIDNFKKLTNYIIENLSYEEKMKLFNKRDEILIDYKNCLHELDDYFKSMNSFEKNCLNFIEVFGKTAVTSLAINTILQLAPTVNIKIASGALILLRSSYKLSKNIEYKNIVNKDFTANKLLHKLEITCDDKGKTINTRFNDDMIKYIKDFLRINNIDCPSNYLDLRKCLYGLDIDIKIALINFLNNLTGNYIDTKKEFNGCNETLRSRINSLIVKPITLGSGIGASVATAINAIDPSITVGLYNGSFTGVLSKNLTDNSIIGLVSGAIGGILTKAFQYVPVIGEGLENVIAKENLVVTAVLGAICYLGYNSFKNIYHSLIKVIDKKIFLHNYRLDLALDSKFFCKRK